VGSVESCLVVAGPLSLLRKHCHITPQPMIHCNPDRLIPCRRHAEAIRRFRIGWVGLVLTQCIFRREGIPAAVLHSNSVPCSFLR